MKLSIAEGLYLLVLDDEEGRLLSAVEKNHIHGILSAALFELIILKKINVKDGKLSVADKLGTANGVLDKVLEQVEGGHSFTEEVERLQPHFLDIREDLDAFLIQRGILKKEETRLLWIPLSERMGNKNYAFEREIRNGLKSVVLTKDKPSKSFLLLFCLVYFCGILDEIFIEKDEMIDAVKVAKDIVNSDSLDPEITSILKELRLLFDRLKESVK
ncbi:MAG: hypothetical protein ACJAZM_002661 [Cyclobacteriaceae bacterium]|jgi:Golgi phosphoprotein 3